MLTLWMDTVETIFIRNDMTDFQSSYAIHTKIHVHFIQLAVRRNYFCIGGSLMTRANATYN